MNCRSSLLYIFSTYLYIINSLTNSVINYLLQIIFHIILHNSCLSHRIINIYSLLIKKKNYNITNGINFMIFSLIFVENCLKYDVVHDYSIYLGPVRILPILNGFLVFIRIRWIRTIIGLKSVFLALAFGTSGLKKLVLIL